MKKKFVPSGDMDFVAMAENYARCIAKEPQRYAVSQDESGALSAAVTTYRAALQTARFGSGRSAAATRAKHEARKQAENIIRPMSLVIRANSRIDAAAKVLLGIKERSTTAKTTPCPKEPPRLRFIRPHHEMNGMPIMHELSFCAHDNWNVSKPHGAARLELFMDLIPPDEPIPAHPGANHGGRPWYLRSFTRTPFKVQPRMAGLPMRVVYWGRWANSMGEVGPFSETAVGWVEGGSHYSLPGGTGPELGSLGTCKPILIVDHDPASGPAERDESYRLEVLAMRYRSMSGGEIVDALPAPDAPFARETRQLEGPRALEQEAA